MKVIQLITLLIFLTLPAFLQAQQPIVLSEDSIVFNTSKLPGIIVSIPEVDYERTEKKWIKAMEEGTKSKAVNETGVMTIFGAYLKEISPNPVNLYSKLLNRDSLLLLQVSIELKKDLYLDRNSGDAGVIAAKEYLKQFAKDQYIDFVKGEVQAEDKKLKDLNDDLEDLENEKSRMQKSIQSNKTNITSEKSNIEIQNLEITKLSAEILAQNQEVISMEEGAAKDGKASYLKDMEKRKKKLLNDIESSENKINKANSDIDEANRNIPKNEEEQEVLRGKVAQQETVVQLFTDKLEKVKVY